MESNECRAPILLELDINRRGMSGEDQTRLLHLGTLRIRKLLDREINADLGPDLASRSRESRGIPCSEAVGVSEVSTLEGVGGIVQQAMIV